MQVKSQIIQKILALSLMTQTDLAKSMNITPQRISSMKCGKFKIRPETVKKLLDAAKLSPELKKALLRDYVENAYLSQ